MNMRKHKLICNFLESDNYLYIKEFGLRVFNTSNILTTISVKYHNGLNRNLWPVFLYNYKDIPPQYVNFLDEFTWRSRVYYIISLREYSEYYMVFYCKYTRKNPNES